MSSERDDNLEGERLKKAQETEKRLKLLEEQNASLVSNNERLLGESKKFKEQARGYETLKEKEESDRIAANDAVLREQGEYKKLMEQREERIKTLEQEKEDSVKEAKEARETLSDAKKIAAFQRRLGGQIENDDYLAFIDTASILIIDGKIDSSSVDGAVKKFLSKHEGLVNFGAKRMPNGQGGNGKGSKFNQEQWTKTGNKNKIDNFEETYKAHQK